MIIASGGGRIDGRQYTNSVEACELSIASGFKYIELDVSRFSDGYACAHDGLEKQFFGIDARFGEISLAEFSSKKVAGRWTPLTFRELESISDRNQHVSWVLDSKFSDECYRDFLIWVGANHPSLVQRVIPQVYSPQDAKTARDAGFSRAIFALWKHHWRDWLGPGAIEAISQSASVVDLQGICLRLFLTKHFVERTIDDPRLSELRRLDRKIILHYLGNANPADLLDDGYGIYVFDSTGIQDRL